LLGNEMLNWHLYALLLRFLGALAFFWALRLLFPQQKTAVLLMSVLFVAYPGFLSQPNANTKSNHLYGFASALFSIAFTLQALQPAARRWQRAGWLSLSFLFTLNYLFIYEYMLGFEATRILLIGYSLLQRGLNQRRRQITQTLAWALPNLLATAGFIYWRIFLFESTRSATNVANLAADYFSNLRQMGLRLVFQTLTDFLDLNIFAWFVHPYFLISRSEYSELAWALLSGILAAGAVWLSLRLVSAQEAPPPAGHFVTLGALSVLFGIFPVILSDRQVDLMDAYKSYGLHPIGGAVMLLVGLASLLPPKARQASLLAFLGLSVSAQMLNANYWAQYWDFQRQTWWQLTWRAPDIQDDTLVMAYFMNGYQLQQDYEIWGPVNLIYRPGTAERPAISAEVLTAETVYEVFTASVKDNRVRDIRMHRDFGNLLLLSLPAKNSCLHVMDGALPVYSEAESLLVKQAAPYSHTGQIRLEAAPLAPNPGIFGTEPPHGWCYYYQKASLARQAGNWQEITRLYDETLRLGLEASDHAEYIPFVEGLVNTGRIADAQNIYNQQIKGRKALRYPLCQSLSAPPASPPGYGYDYETIFRVLCE
jgi:hypothetical protein